MRHIPLLLTILLLSCNSPTKVCMNVSRHGSKHTPQIARQVATAQGRGKYIILHPGSTTLCNIIYIKQNDSSQFKEYRIESLENNIWHKLKEGSTHAQTIVLRFEPRFFNKVRLHIKQSHKIPTIEEFSLYYVPTQVVAKKAP